MSHDGDPPAVSATGGAAGAAGAAGLGGGGGPVGGGIIVVDPSIDVGGSCSVDGDAPIFREQAVQTIGKQRVLYSWTTDEQVAELRAGGELFSRSEKPGMGRGLLFDTLTTLTSSTDPVEAQLAEVLGTEIFAKVRFAWPNPWATLLGLSEEDYGTQLLRVELKPEAWIAFLGEGGLSVIDEDEQPVALSTALVTPERIGAIYFVSTGDNNLRCDTFSQSGVSFREFALGNIAMVARWSLATSEIKERLQSDIDRLGELEKELDCLRYDPGDWPVALQCGWTRLNPIVSSLDSYYFSLGLPNDLYMPSRENLEALIAALETTMPTGEPLIVTPSQ
jgi:hypothetical protein